MAGHTDPKLRKAEHLAKAALARLQENGHQPGCVCNLCVAARAVLIALHLIELALDERPKAGQLGLFLGDTE